MNKENALKNLIKVRDILDSFFLRYFLIDGTLLGFVREKDFISYDNDIDIGVFINEWDKDIFLEFYGEMLENGFNLYHTFGEFGKEFEVAWFKDGVKIDFFFYRKENQKLVFNAFKEGGRKYPQGVITYGYDIDLIEPLEERIFLGEKFSVPHKPEKVLEAKYGDWKKVVKNWDWALSPKNIININ